MASFRFPIYKLGTVIGPRQHPFPFLMFSRLHIHGEKTPTRLSGLTKSANYKNSRHQIVSECQAIILLVKLFLGATGTWHFISLHEFQNKVLFLLFVLSLFG